MKKQDTKIKCERCGHKIKVKSTTQPNPCHVDPDREMRLKFTNCLKCGHIKIEKP